ncbi:MAG: hypothetical protein U9Q05_12430 [Thermodesulfobacteriota bacterium]|nr:hypothetical protein [Thermodesulfobacteriota bacterium]
MKVKFLILIFCSAVVFSPPTAFGQEDPNWNFDLAPLYLWAINIEGETGVRGQTAGTEIDFGDIYDNLQGVFTVRFNAIYKQKFGVLVDYNYLNLGKEKETGVVDLEVSMKTQILNLAATYRLMDGRHTLDGVAGIRYNVMGVDIDFTGTGLNIDEDKDWTDPIIGARYAYQMTDKWTLRLYGDIGGFGVSSNFTWQGVGLIDFHPWKHVAIVAGYRVIDTDYESGSGSDKFTYDARVHGPLVGLDIRF